MDTAMGGGLLPSDRDDAPGDIDSAARRRRDAAAPPRAEAAARAAVSAPQPLGEGGERWPSAALEVHSLVRADPFDSQLVAELQAELRKAATAGRVCRRPPPPSPLSLCRTKSQENPKKTWQLANFPQNLPATSYLYEPVQLAHRSGAASTTISGN
jgi:hypothetical protein